MSICFLPLAAQQKSWSSEDFQLNWKIAEGNLIMTFAAKTSGWLSVGFEPSAVMKDADIIIMSVDDQGKVNAEDHFGVSMISHKNDTELGGRSDVKVVSGSEKNGITTVTFSIPLSSGDSKDKTLAEGKKVKIILASGDKDNFKVKHNKKAKGEIIL